MNKAQKEQEIKRWDQLRYTFRDNPVFVRHAEMRMYYLEVVKK
jgi:hypothetical protein